MKTPFTTSEKDQLNIPGFAAVMLAEGYRQRFVELVSQHAMEYQGTYDLMLMWCQSTDIDERRDISCDLEQEIGLGPRS